MAAAALCFLAVLCSLLHQAFLIFVTVRSVQAGMPKGPVSNTHHRGSGERYLSGLSINCYQCNSHNDSRCLMEKLPDSLRLPCGPKDTMCRKISQVVEFEMNGMPPDSRVIRGCGWDESSYKGRCYQRAGFGGRQEVCSCLEDGCNSATIPVAATFLMLLTVAILRF